MSDAVLIVLIVSVTLVATPIIFRRQLSRFLFKASKTGIEAELETREIPERGRKEVSSTSATSRPTAVSINGNKLIGVRNAIEADGTDVAITDNLQAGSDQKIGVRQGRKRN
jgi:hypothetical protein